MPHVALVPFTGFRLREERMRELGMHLPGLHQRAGAIAQLPALGLLTLAGMTPEPWTCSYQETVVADETAMAGVLATKPTLVALSALTASVEEAYRFGGQLRREGVAVILGGLHATACPEEAARYGLSVVAGEGEPVWAQVLADAARGELQPVYRPGQLFDLQQAPVPRFDLLGKKARPRFTVQTQRGCPLACDFCGASRLLGAFREKPLANLQRELHALTDLVPEPVLELADDNTFAGNRNAAALLDALGTANARYFTEADWRIGERPDVLRHLAASGCVQVLVGIESLIFRHPGMGPKQAELSRMMDAAQAIQEAGVAVIGCCILGCDGETRASLDRLTQFLLDCPLADVQLTLQTPFPSTALYRRLHREGRLLPDRSWEYYTLFDVAYQPDLLSVAELEQGFRDVVSTVHAAAPSDRRAALRYRIWQKHPRFRR